MKSAVCKNCKTAIKLAEWANLNAHPWDSPGERENKYWFHEVNGQVFCPTVYAAPLAGTEQEDSE